MANKTKFNSEPFKLQVYVNTETVMKIDLVCKHGDMYRSGFVTEAILSMLATPKYAELLDGIDIEKCLLKEKRKKARESKNAKG